MKKSDKFLLGTIITLFLYIKASEARGYANPGGEILVVPLFYALKYINYQIRESFLDEEE